MSRPVEMWHPDSGEPVLVHPSQVENMRRQGWEQKTAVMPAVVIDDEPQELDSDG